MNDNLNLEDNVVIEGVETKKHSGLGITLVILAGGAVAAGLVAGGKALKKVWKKHKNKENMIEVDTTEYEEAK